jgi:hypothetical protein
MIYRFTMARMVPVIAIGSALVPRIRHLSGVNIMVRSLTGGGVISYLSDRSLSMPCFDTRLVGFGVKNPDF